MEYSAWSTHQSDDLCYFETPSPANVQAKRWQESFDAANSTMFRNTLFTSSPITNIAGTFVLTYGIAPAA